MARPDFSNVWGSTNAPFTAITDTDYKAGWVFRTGAPPRRVNFDYFQNLSDLRHEWLGEQMLLAVGHEWQADVSYDAYAVTRSPVNGQLYRSLVGSNIGNEPSVSGANWALGVSQNTDYLNTTRINVASAATVDLTALAPNTRNIRLTGSVAITGFTVAAGQRYLVSVAAAPTLTNNAAIVTNSGANVVCAAGDTFELRATAANVVEIAEFVSAGLIGKRVAGNTDFTVGKLIGVGFAGVGGDIASLSAAGAFDDLVSTVGVSWWRCSTVNVASVNGPPGAVGGILQHQGYIASANASQRYTEVVYPARTFTRSYFSSAWSTWKQQISTDDAFGFGQTWQDVTGSRALSTTYTNSTGKAIGVFVKGNNGGGQVNQTFTVSGVGQVIYGYTGTTNHTSIVPDGATYSLTGSTMVEWQELR